MSATMNPEVRTRLDKHLDAVEAALVAAGNSREQRRAVLDDLEAQIRDMLAARSAMPTAADVEAVLAQLDSPAAYASDVPKLPASAVSAPISIPPPPCRSRLAFAALITVLASFALIVVANAVLWAVLVPDHTPGSHSEESVSVVPMQLIILLLAAVGVAGTTLGWVAFGRIRRSNGALRGTAPALFAGLFYPAILGVSLLVRLLWAGHGM